MAEKKTLTFLIMDPPYENARSTTALRLIEAALRRDFNVNVFAYEGAVAIPFAKQAPHANSVHGRDVIKEVILTMQLGPL
jgi:tRNA 2-thiouridine synthesizing protein D